MFSVIRPLLLPVWGLPVLWSAAIDDGVALKQSGDHAGAEAAFSAVITQDPTNASAIAERATVRSWQQKYDEALADYAEAIRLSPTETAWRVGQSRVLYWKGECKKALQAIDQAITMRPNDPALWELKGDIAIADGQQDMALAAYREADLLLPNGSAAAKLTARAWAPTAWRLDVYAVSNRYSTERGVEPGFSASLGYRSFPVGDSSWSWYAQGGIARTDQFGAIDVTYAGQVGAQVAKHLEVHAGGTVTPQAAFEPDWRALGGVEIMIVPQATVLFDVVHSDYSEPQQQVVTALPGIRLEPNPWLTIDARVTFTADHLASTQSTPAVTDHTNGWQGKVGLHLGRYHPYISYAQGSEPEPPLPPADTKAVWGGVVFDVNRTLALRVDAAYEDRLNAYHRVSLGAGVSVRF